MKQITIISGKGGTGKTTITAAFSSLAKNAVLADCDVDAADLHLILKPKIIKTSGFHGLKIPKVDMQRCTKCNKCTEACKFNAITEEIIVKKDQCEGCGVCAYVCPVDAIELVDRDSGFSYISETRFGPLSHALLNTAEEASGKLVTVVRTNAKDIARSKKKDLILIDGPPGIGCPVIASITGVDLVVIVTEPTLSAIHDLKRILNVSQHFHIPAVVCINKYDINHDNSLRIEQFCQNQDIPLVGKIPYDTAMTDAMIKEKSIIEYADSHLSTIITNMWADIQKRINE